MGRTTTNEKGGEEGDQIESNLPEYCGSEDNTTFGGLGEVIEARCSRCEKSGGGRMDLQSGKRKKQRRVEGREVFKENGQFIEDSVWFSSNGNN